VLEQIVGERYPDGAAHGSGCTHSSALAAHLALGATPLEAAQAAKRIAGEAVRDGIRGLGAGPGPVDVLALTTGRRARPSGGPDRPCPSAIIGSDEVPAHAPGAWRAADRRR
jgi:hydroxymethylpyrimidine/phosphomethylpyrimidine kinase